MFEGMLNIDIGESEVGKKLLACANAREPFEAFGRQYMVEGISRNFDGVNGWIRAEMREVAKLEWRGPEDGLPPVGLEVEVQLIPAGKRRPEWEWAPCRVVKHDRPYSMKNDVAVVEVLGLNAGGGIQYVFGEVENFRTIRTLEQLEDEKRERHIDAMLNIARLTTSKSGAELHEYCAALYDSGCRMAPPEARIAAIITNKPCCACEQQAEKERKLGVGLLFELMEGSGSWSAAEHLYKAGVRAPEVK